MFTKLKYKFSCSYHYLFLTITFILIIPSSILYAQTWQQIDMHFPPGDTLLSDALISFVSKSTGWIHTSGLIDIDNHSSGYMTKIFNTTDGGINWNLQYTDSSYGGWVIFGVDSLHCWAWGKVNFPSYQVDYLLSTKNGGATWDTVDVPDKSVYNIYFFNKDEGIIFGSRPWFTTDGGKSWTEGQPTYKIGLPEIKFVGKNKGWSVSDITPFATDAGFISNTTDGGQTWKYQDSITLMLYGIDFIDTLKGFAVGTNLSFGAGIIYSTNDGGEHWFWKQFAKGAMFDVGFINSTIAWVTGIMGRIWKTSDGGTNWELNETGLDATLKKIIVLPEENTAYIFGGKGLSGTSGYHYPFVLLYADLSSITDVEQNNNDTPSEFQLMQNYPNPFNPSTIIWYEIPGRARNENALVSLKVYDVLGNEIATLVNEEKPTGNYEVEFSAAGGGSELSSGIYFYRLQAGEYNETKKMILLR